MDGLLLMLLLALNIGIGVWNCYVVGVSWKDVIALGGTWEKALLWCASIQSVVAFSLPILLALSAATVAYLSAGEEPRMTAEDAKLFMEWVTSLWYVGIIVPCLMSGFMITVYSVREAVRRRDLASGGVAAWNVAAQAYNTISALNNIGGALTNVGSLFDFALKGGDGKAKLAKLAIVLVILSIMLGAIVTFALIRHFAKNALSQAEGFERARA